MEERSINEVSSGEDSDVEFLDCGSLRQQRRDLDSPFHDIGDSMMFEESVATEDNARHDQSDQMLRFGSVTKELNVNNKASSKNGKWEYVCKRCYKPGETHSLTRRKEVKKWQRTPLIINRPSPNRLPNQPRSQLRYKAK